MRLRVAHAAVLFHDRRVDRIVVTGGGGPPSEAEAMRGLLRAAGVPDGAVIPEGRAANTFENLIFARALLPPDTAVTIVSSRWHLPRARLIAAILGWRVAASGPRGTAPRPAAIRAALREVAAVPPSAMRALGWRLRGTGKGL